jgi:hypothetical protein
MSVKNTGKLDFHSIIFHLWKTASAADFHLLDMILNVNINLVSIKVNRLNLTASYVLLKKNLNIKLSCGTKFVFFIGSVKKKIHSKNSVS